MKIKLTLSIGLLGDREDEHEIPDEELEGMSDEEKAQHLHEYWQEWAWNYIDGGASEVPE